MKSDIVDSFSQMVKDKKMDRDVLESVIKDVFGMMLKKKYGLNTRYEVIVNMDKGDIEMYVMREVVETIEDPETQITAAEALEKSGEGLEIGDDYVEVIDAIAFGRRHIVNLKQNLNQKIREIEKEIVYNDYKDLAGEIIVAEIYQIKPTYILLIHNSHEIIFPKGEQIPKERYKKGDNTRVYIKEVQKKPSGPPLIIVSRACDDFLKKLFELEIPEIYDGVIEIKGISREPGERAKVAVYSYDDRIDAVGACVGMKGIRIHSIVRELANENIDVINYSEDAGLYIARALAPAKLKDIYLDKAAKVAKIVADEDQISLIIGKNGQNIKLASRLTGYEIDVERKGGRKNAAAETDVDDEDDADDDTDETTTDETTTDETTTDETTTDETTAEVNKPETVTGKETQSEEAETEEAETEEAETEENEEAKAEETEGEDPGNKVTKSKTTKSKTAKSKETKNEEKVSEE